MLCVKVTLATVTHGPPLWAPRGVSTMACPSWAPPQLFWKRLPSTVTFWACLSSRRFLTLEVMPPKRGSLGFHDKSLLKVLPVIVMLDGTCWIYEYAPPKSTFSPAASR